MKKRLLESTGFNNIVKGRYGYYLYNTNDIYVGQAVEKYGEYSENEARFFKKFIAPGDVVFDVGANIGTHTLAFSNFVGDSGRVYAFEPQRVVFQTLCGTMAINSKTNVVCLPNAVSDKEKFLFIPYPDYSEVNNFGAIEASTIAGGYPASEMAMSVMLDEFCFRLTNAHISFIKIDVEGMELNAIRGADRTIKKHKPVLYVENDRVDRSKGLMDHIRSLGYEIYWHVPFLYNAGNYFQEKENIYANVGSWNIVCFAKDVAYNHDFSSLDKVTDTSYHPLKETQNNMKG